MQPVGPDDLAPLFPMDLIMQEVTADSYVDIPDEVLDVYRLWRPSPLFRAHRLEKALGTPARIYYKYEGVSPGRLAQAEHRRAAGVLQRARAASRKLTTETGAGQWGTALAFACALFGIECEIWQVGASYDGKPYRRSMMEIFGATVHRSARPTLTESGRTILADDPDHPGQPRHRDLRGGRGRGAPTRRRRYALGSVLNHVLLHQTIIGEEALLQFAMVGETPDLHGRLHRRRLELRRAVVPVPAREAGRPDEPDRSAASSRRRARR